MLETLLSDIKKTLEHGNEDSYDRDPFSLNIVSLDSKSLATFSEQDEYVRYALENDNYSINVASVGKRKSILVENKNGAGIVLKKVESIDKAKQEIFLAKSAHDTYIKYFGVELPAEVPIGFFQSTNETYAIFRLIPNVVDANMDDATVSQWAEQRAIELMQFGIDISQTQVLVNTLGQYYLVDFEPEERS